MRHSLTAIVHRAWPAAAFAAATVLSGCYYPPAYVTAPPPYPTTTTTSVPASFERSWNAALDAAYDSGVRVTSQDRNTGTIRGTLSGSDVIITVQPKADGGVSVAFNATGPRGQDSAVANQLAQAYNRRMGR
ncbi:MAG: hypothetical protein WCA12_07025 [Burkholderiales bacterium]